MTGALEVMYRFPKAGPLCQVRGRDAMRLTSSATAAIHGMKTRGACTAPAINPRTPTSASGVQANQPCSEENNTFGMKCGGKTIKPDPWGTVRYFPNINFHWSICGTQHRTINAA